MKACLRTAIRCSICALLVSLVLLVGACQRAKPPRIVTPPTPDGELAAAQPDAEGAPVLEWDEADSPSDLALKGIEPLDITPAPLIIEPTLMPTVAIYTPTPTPPEITYTVRTGDTLLAIAIDHDTTTQAIINRNRLADPNRLTPGQVLTVPVGPDYQPEVAVQAAETLQHAIVQGETLLQLAIRYRTTRDAILRANPEITDPERLPVGRVLTIPLGDEPPLRTHVVQPGEGLSMIAERYGVRTQQLISANGLTDPDDLRVGQVLVIPD